MKKVLLSLGILCISFMNAQNYNFETKKDPNQYSYQTVKNDATGVRIYTLKNGLKVYLAKNTEEPRIQTYIPIRTGSNNDPQDNTGLAHYLEHMVFKGTSKFGTKDWEKEKMLIAQISDLFEQHKSEKDTQKKIDLYKKIDAVSQEASKYAVANEYDKLISSLGAKGTNAHTWLNETVYKNNIPSIELEKWMKIEKERFSELVLRLFHTELEAVYEEFNRAQDNDGRLVNYELMDALFPKTPYGQQTTIGKSEHLKNPSMVAIHQYFNTYYVPNNMAVVLVGDLDFDKTIKMVDNYFGKFEYKELPKIKKVSESPMTTVEKREVKSPTAERLLLAWRTDGVGSKQAMMTELISNLLSNQGGVGLIDLHINQAQKALGASSFMSSFNDYGYHGLSIGAKENQSLEETQALVLAEIENIKNGKFDDWMLNAIINNMELNNMKTLETTDGLATELYSSFIQGRSWDSVINEINEFKKISKKEIVEFANQFYKDNYVVVYKRKGVNDRLVRVQNPGITPIQLNRDSESDFYKNFSKLQSKELLPEFIDYNKEIQSSTLKNTKVSFIKNKNNQIASLYYLFEMGSDHNKKLPLAIEMINFLGTKQLSAEQVKKEFYKIGINYGVNTSNDMTSIYLSGLEKNLPKGIQLLEDLLENIQPDQKVLQTTIATILNGRLNAKKRKESIMNALLNYAKYGKNSRFRDIVSENELKNLQAKDLTEIIKSLTQYKHQIFYYGSNLQNIKATLQQFHHLDATLPIPTPMVYEEPATSGKVYFANYDMVQAEMNRIASGKQYNPELSGVNMVFNSYFGSGLSSIFFQEIRESKSLAYSANAIYRMASDKMLRDYMSVSVGTQANKLPQAVEATSALLNEMPKIEQQFNNAKSSTLKQIASSRITKSNIFFSYLALQKLGINTDIRKQNYANIQNLNLNSINDFFNKEVKNKVYNTAIIGKKESMNMDALKKIGTIEEVSLEEIFNY